MMQLYFIHCYKTVTTLMWVLHSLKGKIQFSILKSFFSLFTFSHTLKKKKKKEVSPPTSMVSEFLFTPRYILSCEMQFIDGKEDSFTLLTLKPDSLLSELPGKCGCL